MYKNILITCLFNYYKVSSLIYLFTHPSTRAIFFWPTITRTEKKINLLEREIGLMSLQLNNKQKQLTSKKDYKKKLTSKKPKVNFCPAEVTIK